MAEDFIQEIYKRGSLIAICKECEQLLYMRNYGAMGDSWKKNAPAIVDVCEVWG